MSHLVASSLDILGYIGPGVGGGVLAVVVGVIVSIALALFAVVWYPIKRFLGLGKKSAKTQGVESTGVTGASDA